MEIEKCLKLESNHLSTLATLATLDTLAICLLLEHTPLRAFDNQQFASYVLSERREAPMECLEKGEGEGGHLLA